MERAIKHFINDAAGHGNQNQISPGLTPLIAVIVRQLFGQSTVDFFADARWQRLATRKVLLNTRWQCRAWAPVIAMLTHDAQSMLAVYAGALVVGIAIWTLALGLITTWLTLMRILRLLTLLNGRLSFITAITRPIAITVPGIGQRRSRATRQRKASQCGNQ